MSADANPALRQLGLRLARARQACGYSLEQQADRLNMGREQLQALERGDREGLPEPVFVIAQARRVASSLGIEIDAEIEALRSSDGFRTPRAGRTPAEPEPDGPRPGRGAPPADGAGPTQHSPAVRRSLLGLLIALAAAGATLFGLRQGFPHRSPVHSSPTPSAPASPEVARPVDGQR